MKCRHWLAKGAVSLAFGLSVWGCGASPSGQSRVSDAAANEATSDRPLVVTTYTMLADLTEQIGCGAIDHRGLLDPGADPHLYEPVPQDSQAIEDADLIFYNGYNLEPALIRLIRGDAVTGKSVAVGERVESLAIADASEPDPHVWGDVENAIVMVDAIAAELSAIAPESADSFQVRAEILATELARLDAWIEDTLETIPAEQRRLVTSHDAFQYYANAYGIQVLGTLIGISTEEQPSARTVARLVDAVRAAGVPTIFAETTINPQLIETVATEAGVELASPALYSDSIGVPGSEGESYLGMMATNTRTIALGLGGQVQPFESSAALTTICEES